MKLLSTSLLLLAAAAALLPGATARVVVYSHKAVRFSSVVTSSTLGTQQFDMPPLTAFGGDACSALKDDAVRGLLVVSASSGCSDSRVANNAYLAGAAALVTWIEDETVAVGERAPQYNGYGWDFAPIPSVTVSAADGAQLLQLLSRNSSLRIAISSAGHNPWLAMRRSLTGILLARALPAAMAAAVAQLAVFQLWLRTRNGGLQLLRSVPQLVAVLALVFASATLLSAVAGPQGESRLLAVAAVRSCASFGSAALLTSLAVIAAVWKVSMRKQLQAGTVVQRHPRRLWAFAFLATLLSMLETVGSTQGIAALRYSAYALSLVLLGSLAVFFSVTGERVLRRIRRGLGSSKAAAAVSAAATTMAALGNVTRAQRLRRMASWVRVAALGMLLQLLAKTLRLLVLHEPAAVPWMECLAAAADSMVATALLLSVRRRHDRLLPCSKRKTRATYALTVDSAAGAPDTLVVGTASIAGTARSSQHASTTYTRSSAPHRTSRRSVISIPHPAG